ncbi:hypothetical protein [Streptomyces sp. AC555_RSS877]|uniref:hypothetical protein n=1 Tax=Streptomyces sp. AC555_RSS877 TaxID=2823688 RepID=UPI001C264A87|nr:hypothetical protein [Streptomyces sp. AC555_RSS877]
MPRIKLANWYGDHKPGDEIDVDEVTLKALHRDGIVAEVVGYDNGGVLEPGSTEAVNASGETEAVEAAPQQEQPAQPEPAVETGRKRR